MTAGSGDWLAVLNKLAGTSGQGENACGNAYAGTHGMSLLGALNHKAGTSGWGLNAVCNKLAGTSGMEAQQALAILAGAADA